MRLPVVALLALAGCSSVSNNDDGIAFLEVRGGVNSALERDVPLQLHGVARNAAGDSVGIPIVWLTRDTAIVTLDSTLGVIQAKLDTGTVRVQATTRGKSPLATDPSALTFTVTAKAESLVVRGADSLNVLTGVTTSPPILFALLGQGGVPVARRPVQFRIIEPAYAAADTPSVWFSSRRIVDSATSAAGTGLASLFLTRVADRPTPSRVVVEVRAFRATGAPILGSGKRIVIRFEQ